mmetsp:Transcript_15216/g.28449  ORF Transcript_15216/g.28449 Transcript_15216/m.28449 type:complete len:402 (+) Transcript_15216:523-1728(+)|eukprot:CAMPEP_0178772602 /NCGR_PEP_ID=MMETSP0744-20121128/22643_1 /TAXON_ID=913974 /ORGANISM="Nitzschia punctata, Strain CCMP561" /LENGTH=401 /DNA_ID=CAMNT_0020429317 /DNA_START=391 /DNA_END=1596 /DNA_ORIENTATION=+
MTTTTPPKDDHTLHIWVLEPPKEGGVLTKDGCEQIARHKYQAGSYTYLDTLLNPFWTFLTERLPLWMAPNVVTTIGGVCCWISYIFSVSYLKQGTEIPTWLYLWNSFSLFAYYTLDCMDGKQARRTNSSSPLGQLFDHGIDAMGNLSHVQAVQCIFQLCPQSMVVLQCSLQTAFYQAQWEEYYTGSLPHATGNVGVTEVTYGMAVWSLLTALFGRNLYDYPLLQLDTAPSWWLWWTGGISQVQIKHIAAILWIFLVIGLTILSYIRVYNHVQSPKVFLSAVSKLAGGPWLLSFVGIVINQQPTLALGLSFCLITIKIIVLSMAKMAYASLQLSIVPFCIASVWLRYFEHEWFTENMKQTLEWALDIYYLISISMWARRAISQLCQKLNVKLFRIDHTQKKE